MEKITQLTKIATLLSIIIGIYVTASSAVHTLNSSRISAVNEIKPLIKEDLSIRKQLVVYMENQMNDDMSYVKASIAQGKSGELLFYSDHLNDYQKITSYYENLGSILNWENSEFNIVFDMLAFPDEFYLKTKEMRKLISNNWHSKGVPLNDIFSDFDALCLHYQEKRADQGLRHLDNSECKS